MELQFISKDKETGKYTLWGTATNETQFFALCQYFLDSISGLEDFIIRDCVSGRCYDFLGITTKVLGMRKRTFNERMNNVITGRETA